MFPKRAFPNRMFAPRYWPKVGATATVVPATGGSLVLVPGRQRVVNVPPHVRLVIIPRSDRS